MQKRSSFFPAFLFFLFLIGIIFLFSQSNIFGGFFEKMTLPLQKITFGIFNLSEKSTEDKLRQENMKLTTELAAMAEIEKENKALHDQFAISTPSSKSLLPAQVIGRHDEDIIVDKGKQDGIETGQIVVLKDNVVGQVSEISIHRAVIKLLGNSSISFTANTAKTEASGVISGKGEGNIIFDKVLLSEKLEKDDVVITKGDVEIDGLGYMPGLVVGKISSVNKKASSLFQSAEIKSLVDFEKLETVFILVGK